MESHYDIVIAGGGINGAAVARDAAGRGAKVLLVEQDDLAAHTSSASTKLIHGGLRYLEHYEFRLVHEALAERERLMRAAPHLIRPLQFVLPHDRSMRPAWMMRIGLLIYDRLGGRNTLPRSRAVRLDRSPLGAGLQPDIRKGFSYWDCWGDDSRLVIANLQDAAGRGADVLKRTRLLTADRSSESWRALIELSDGRCQHVTARAMVNATGAWAADFLPRRAGIASSKRLRLIKGSHIITRKLYEGDHAYTFQNPDQRIVFAIPYEDEFTLIGTTDVAWEGSPADLSADHEEVEYLCQSANRWLGTPITPDDVVWSYAGLRPLVDDHEADPSQISRDYVLSLDTAEGQAPLVSIFGGKITTHRALADKVADLLSPFFPEFGPSWTEDAAMPGGELGPGGLPGLIAELRESFPFIDQRTIVRMAESYGSRVRELLDGFTCASDLGENFGGGLTATEVDYLIAHEWAETAQDILWRRSKLGLHLQPAEIARLETHINGASAVRSRVNTVA